MTNNDVLELFNTKSPKTIRAVERLGFEPKLIGAGLYRKTYRLVGTNYVVKIPNNTDGIVHARLEYKAYSELKNYRKYRVLWKYLPEMSYYNEVTGVTVMPYYKPIDDQKGKARHIAYALAAVIYDLVRNVWKKSNGTIDLHDGNIGLGENNEPVLIDMGYFYGPQE